MALLPQDPKKQKQLLLGLLPVVLAFLYYNFYHKDRAATLETNRTTLETVQQENDATRALVAQYGRDLPQRLAILEEHIKQLEGLIPRREDVPLLIQQITATALQMNVQLTALNPQAEQAGEFYSRQAYDLQVLGDYHAIGDYLTQIGSLPRIVRSTDMKLSVDALGAGPGGVPRLRAAFRIETYVMPDAVADTAAVAVANGGG